MKRYPFVKQTSSKDCGVACLSMIIQYYKGFISMDDLFEMTKTTKNGTTAYNIVEAAKEIGFNSYGMKGENWKSNELILPAISHVIMDGIYPHFVVIYHIDLRKQELLIADPARNLLKMSFDEFEKIATNHFIILHPTYKIPKNKITNKKNIMSLFPFPKKDFLKLFVFIQLEMIVSFYNLYNFTFLWSLKFKSIIPILLGILLKLFITNCKERIILSINSKTMTTIMKRAYRNILNLPYRYYRNHTTGDMISRMNDLIEVKDFITIFALITNQLFLIVSSMILLFFISFNLFIVTIFIGLFYLMTHFLILPILIKRLNHLKRQNEKLNSYMTESIFGFESIKGLNLEKNFEEEFSNKNAEYQKKWISYQFLNSKLNILKEFFENVSTVLIFFVGILLVQENKLSYQNLMLFYFIFSYFMGSLKCLLDFNETLKIMKISLKRILELLHKEPIKKMNVSGTIQLQGSEITLDDNKIISNVSFELKPTDKIMMIGPSGSGKSTILKTLKQYYESDNIYINKVNYNNFNFNDKIAYISQNEYLFTDTMLKNITLGRKIEQKEIEKVIKICELEELINQHSLGINMLIEENGFNLSGGERQRVILARALIGSFDYLFIDEGLSQLDISMERKIIKNLLHCYPNQCVIIVSHRLDNMDLFHKVIKIEKEVEVLEKA